jgi:hypothetical protein
MPEGVRPEQAICAAFKMVSKDSRIPFRRLRIYLVYCFYSGLCRMEALRPATSCGKSCAGHCFGHRLARASSLLVCTRLVDFSPRNSQLTSSDWSSSRVMASITTMLPEQCAVIHDGNLQHIPGVQIVPGDILRIKMGDKVPARKVG